MIPRPVVLGLVAAACVTAAAAGAFVALRQNAADRAVLPAASTVGAGAAQSRSQPQRVSETEAVVGQPSSATADIQRPASQTTATSTPSQQESHAAAAPVVQKTKRDAAPRPQRSHTEASKSKTSESVPSTPDPPSVRETPPMQPATVPAVPELGRAPEIVPAAPEPKFVEVALPSSSVIGLQVETSLSSERARIEDRIEARVTRDVTAEGRVAIPAGSRVIGSVTLVERGGKMKDRARLGIRFHTLVLADGTEVVLKTEPIFREGESPGGDSARKIGGAAIGGAILGAILGGGKGAVVGGATGAGAGTAAVMAGDRNAATLPAGTVVTVRLAEPVTIQVEKN